jgi:hypothetical protein
LKTKQIGKKNSQQEKMLERNSRKKSDEILSKISAFSVKNSDF